jgi:hypothetical protein
MKNLNNLTMKTKTTLLIALIVLAIFQSEVVFGQAYTVGTNGADIPTLKDAFDYINAGTLQGDIVLHVIDNTTESETAVLYENGYAGTSSYTSVTIYPIESGKTISGNFAGALISLNSATNVTIDGRLHDSGGSVLSNSVDLTFANEHAGDQTVGSSTLQFINSASSNTIKYCNILGSEVHTSQGIIFFTTAGSGNGNDDNIIDNNNISNYGGVRAVNAIFSLGTPSFENSGLVISNNNIYDCLLLSTNSNCINLDDYTTSCTITGNHIYETTSLEPSNTMKYIAIFVQNSGSGFTISDNFIGGSSASCGGTAWTKTNAGNNIFYPIFLDVASGTINSVQNNTIKNFSWSNSGSAEWVGIYVQGTGNVNVGTSTGNKIGESSGVTGSISVSGGATGTNVFGINIAGTGTVDCQKNSIDYITVGNASANASNFCGINKTVSAGTTTISYNTINNINSSSTSSANAQTVFGIKNAGTGIINIGNNTISNLNNGTTNISNLTAGIVNGITSLEGTNTINNNIINSLTIANKNNAATQTASVSGIALTGNTNVKTISGNTIFNLSNSNTTFAGSVIGIYFIGNTGANVVSGNFIYNLTVDPSSVSASIYGIKIASGATTYSNNIISIAGDTKTTVYGIYELGVASNNNNIYHNTISINGSVASGATNKSYALYSNSTLNTRNIRNNVFYNARSTAGGANLHYALYFNSTIGTVTCDYNDYYVSGTGGVIGYYGANKTTLPIVTSQDAESLNMDPSFTSATGTTAISYKLGYDFIGVAGTGISKDFFNSDTRENISFGALELPVNKWVGNSNNEWDTRVNWTADAFPIPGANIIFDDNPISDCVLDQDRLVNNIVNAQSTYKLVINGYDLTVKGLLNFTNGAQIDASAANSKIIFTDDLSEQTIPSGAFVDNQVVDFEINKSSGSVVLNATMKIKGLFTVTSGLLNAESSSSNLEFNSTTAQSIPASVFTNDKVYNLHVNNPQSLTIGSDLTITHNLNFKDGNINTGSNKIKIIDNATVVCDGTSGYIVGTCQKIGNDDFTFPVGSVEHYAPFTIEAPTAIGAVVDVGYVYANTTGVPDWWPHGGNMEVGLHHVSDREYWLVNSSEELEYVTLGWTGNEHNEGEACPHGFCGGPASPFVPSDLAVVYWDGSGWKNLNPSATSIVGNHDAGSLQSTGAKIVFTSKANRFITFGSKDNLNPLPIELVSFIATCDDNNVVIDWSTASEINNEYFVIQRSKDMKNFVEIAKVPGAVNSNSIEEYQFVDKNNSDNSYYRIVQVDLDGKSTCSNTISVSCNHNFIPESLLSVYPNPAHSKLFVDLNGLSFSPKYEIISANGQNVASGIFNLESNCIDIERLNKGLYFLKIEGLEKRIKISKQ